MNNLIQGVSNPFVEAFAAGLICGGNCGMNTGRNAQGQRAGVRFVRFFSQFGASVKIRALLTVRANLVILMSLYFAVQHK